MNISRTQSFVLGIGTLLIFFATSIYMLNQNSRAPIVEQSAPQIEDARASLAKPDLQAGVTLDNFERSETRDGKKLWEVHAVKGRYLPQDNSAQLEEATLYFYREDGSQVQLKAAKAQLMLQGTALLRAEASAGVTMKYNNDTTISAESAVYDKVNNSVFIPGEVKIDSQSMEVSGRVLDANLENKEFIIKENVSSVVKARLRD